MVDAMFERNGMRVHPGPLCTGPWDPNSMHGGPPTVLAGRYLAEHGAGDAFHLARLTVELVRPVPLAPAPGTRTRCTALTVVAISLNTAPVMRWLASGAGSPSTTA